MQPAVASFDTAIEESFVHTTPTALLSKVAKRYAFDESGLFLTV